MVDINDASSAVTMNGHHCIMVSFIILSTSMVVADAWHTVGLGDDGAMVATGNNDDGRCSVGDKTLK